MPIARASPMTWNTILRLCQPSAFSVPNSRTRLATATCQQHGERERGRQHRDRQPPAEQLARLDALDSEPVTSLASELAVVTVAFGISALTSFWTLAI